MKKVIFNILGFLALVVGIIGAFFPVLPTTPLLILAAYFFSSGNPKLFYKIRQNAKFGKGIFNWLEFKVIRPKAKVLSIAMIILSYLIVLYTVESLKLRVLVGFILFNVIWFILSRKENLPKVFLILGHGRLANYLIREILNSNKKAKIYVTSRTPCVNLSADFEIICFNFNEPKTWEYLPWADTTFVTFPLKGEDLAKEFLNEKSHLLGKIVGAGTTSIFPRKHGDIISEESVTDPSHKRWQAEQIFIQKGAIWGLLIGLYGNENPLHLWPKKYPQLNPNKSFNMIHFQKAAAMLYSLSVLGSLGEFYILSEGHQGTWKEKIKIEVLKGNLTQKDFDNFIQRDLPDLDYTLENKKFLSLKPIS